MLPPLVHFYHLYADGNWREAVREHLKALNLSGFSGTCFAGLVGSSENRQAAREALPPSWKIQEQADYGHEQVTLRELRHYALGAPPKTGILYAHTKGTSYSADSLRAQRWRHAMVHETVMAKNVEKFFPEYDVVGAGWLDEPNYFFFGNFWWANAGYISRLPPVSDATRYDAENWLGTGRPKVKDLCPEFKEKYDIGWNYHYRMFGPGRDCPECPLLTESPLAETPVNGLSLLPAQPLLLD